MKLNCELNDGTVTCIPNVNWHANANGSMLVVNASDMLSHFMGVNAYRKSLEIKPRDVSSWKDCVDMIKFAEAPFAVIDEANNVIANIRYGGYDEYWNAKYQ